MALGRVEELALVARSLVGDRRAYSRLVEDTQERLRRFLAGLTRGDTDLADDLAQEAFVKAWINLRQFNARSRFNTWVTTIAVRLFLDEARRRGPVDELPQEAAAHVAEPDIQTGIDARHDAQVALAALSPLDRTIVMMHYFDDQPGARIAAATGLTEGAIRVRLHRARATMARALQPQPQPSAHHAHTAQ